MKFSSAVKWMLSIAFFTTIILLDVGQVTRVKAAVISRVKTWISGETLTASDLNAEFDNILNNGLTLSGIEGISGTVAAMQQTTNPGTVGGESLAVDLTGELKRLRYMLSYVTGKTYWYDHTGRNLGTGNLAVLTGDITDGTIANADMATTAAKAVKANATNASATQTDFAATAAYQILKVNSTNDALIWGTLTANDIGTGTVTVTNLGTDSVGSDEIASGAVGASEIATDAVDTDEIKSNAVHSGEIIDEGVYQVDLYNIPDTTSRYSTNWLTAPTGIVLYDNTGGTQLYGMNYNDVLGIIVLKCTTGGGCTWMHNTGSPAAGYAKFYFDDTSNHSVSNGEAILFFFDGTYWKNVNTEF